MLKFILGLSASFLLSFLLITSNVLAFHKDGIGVGQIDAVEGDKKKDIQSLYCTSSVSVYEDEYTVENEETTQDKEVAIDDDKDTKTQPKSKEKTRDEQLEELLKEFDERQEKKEKELITPKKTKKIFKFQNHHLLKDVAPAVLNISILKDMGKIDSGTTIEKLLSYYCLQPISDKARKFKFGKNSDIAELYDKIAKINGLIDDNGKGHRAFFIQGKILDDAKIYIDVGEPLIYSEANFIHVERERLKKEQKIADQKVADAAAAAAARQAEQDWIAKNKPPLLDAIDKKITEFDDQINKINNDYTKLKIDYENFQKYFKEKLLEVEDLLDLVDVGQKQIKDVAIELKKAKREHLNSNILDDFKSKFKSTKKVKGKHYENYKKLDKLRDAVDKSDKKRHFTKGGLIFKKVGFFTEWERLKNVKLKDQQQGKIDTLSNEIADARKNIINNIDSLKAEIERLEEELSSKFPIIEIAIGFLIFLAVVGFGVYVYLQNKKIKEIRDDADKKVGSLKSDFEGKFKDTSDQIRSVGRRGQQQTSPTQEIVVEKPKTQEEIIAAKYDDLLSDYRDSLDDFSKVAAFKQKWNGLALSRKERQEGTKTILTNSTRAFEKSGIWCVNFGDKYFAFPGSTVKSNMATYMNMDFMKAGQDFKGVFSISEGSSYSIEPAVLRRGGAGFVVERTGKLIFPG